MNCREGNSGKSYIVQGGDTPMWIARRFTGNGERFCELIAQNSHKATVSIDGVTTFADLTVGEILCLPYNWPLFPMGPYETPIEDESESNNY